MKKLFAMVLTLIMCASILSVGVMAAPSGLNSLAIVGENIPGVGEWDPSDPAGDMEEVSESVYVKEVECPAGTSFKFKVAGNDAWDDAFNFGSANIVFGQAVPLENGGGSGDMNVSVSEACTLTITVDLYPLSEGGAATILVESSTGGSNSGSTGSDNGGNNGDSGNAADPGAQFAKPNSLAIVGTGIPGVDEWKPESATGDMTEVSSLVYEIEIGCPAGTSMTFKFAGNDAWDDSCNLGSGAPSIGATCDLTNGSSAQDMQLSVSSDVVLKFTVDLNPLANGTGAATLKIETTDGTVDPNAGGNTSTGDTVTVHARIPESWGENPCFWAWKMADNTNAFANWPGEPMTKNGEWFEIQIPAWADGVIVNDGGTTQTIDLTIEAGKEVWIDVFTTTECEITYSEPGERTEPTTSAPTAPSGPVAPTTGDNTDGEEGGISAEDQAKLEKATRTRVILIVVLVLVWVVVIAEVISIFVPKKN